jgi:xylulokinase
MFMSVAYFLGLDIGTYSSKGVLAKETGEVVASHTVEHPLEMPHPGWAEHDAETTWWKDFREIVQALLNSSSVSPRQIAAAGFSAISSAVLPIDRQGHPLRKAILYGIDTRTTKEIADLQQIIDEDKELRKSGVRLSSQSASPKVLWIRRNEPEVWSKTDLVVNGTGFLLYRLTGETAIDIYDAISFAPFVDFERGCYTADMSRYVAPLERLPRLTWTCEIAGRVNAEGARLSGLAEGTPLITGTSDAAAEAISAGLTDLGDMMVMYGSSIFFILRTPQVYITSNFWGTRFLEPGTYVLTGGMATSGSLTRWFRDQLSPLEMQAEKAGEGNAYVALARLAGGSPLGGNGLVVLPYFAGERTPLLDSDAKGVIFGLDLRHTRGDIYRAVLESVGYGIRHNIDEMKKEGASPKRILAVGGGTYNPLWMQIVSDIADIEQHIPEQQIGASYGDAFLAGIGVSLFQSTAEAAKWVKIKQVIKPNLDDHKKYEEYYRIYRELYTSTRHLMQQLTGLAQGG